MGHSPAIKLAAYYAVIFGLLCAALFWLANIALTQTIQRKQLKAVRNKALEYRAWFLKGETQQLEDRMGEQSLQAGDILFVQIKGQDIHYTNITAEQNADLPREELKSLEGMVEGSNILLGDQRWTIVSIPIGDEGTILQAGKNSQALEEIVAAFRRTSIILLIPGGLLAIAAGALLTYHFLLPTRRLISTMEGILRSGDLSQRAQLDRKGNELNAMVGLFNQLLGENERLITVMQESLDHIAHDLRSPLSRIKITSERALTKERPDPDETKRALEHCAEEIDYIEQLLTVLMNVAEAKSGALALKKEEISASELFQDVMEIYELVAEEKQISIQIECDEAVVFPGDRTRLLQSLANLLDNAIKYSHPRTTVTLAGERSGDYAILSVTDRGIGISDDDLPYIWNRLFRADQSRTEKGMGLGLSLVKAIVVAHGGEVSVESTLGQGSCFHLRMPLSR
ncbi:MAG: HAMP domain-containing sensor histidine kinase [Verrucomicrobiota bacterium]